MDNLNENYDKSKERITNKIEEEVKVNEVPITLLEIANAKDAYCSLQFQYHASCCDCDMTHSRLSKVSVSVNCDQGKGFFLEIHA
jgi:hypothetical protein